MGRPKKEKKEIPFDEAVVKDFISRYFTVQQEIRTLRLDLKELKEEFKNTVDMKLVGKIIRLVKLELQVQCSPETKEDLANIIKDKIGMVVD